MIPGSLTGPESVLYEAILDGQENGLESALQLVEGLPPDLRTWEAAVFGLKLAIEAAKKDRTR